MYSRFATVSLAVLSSSVAAMGQENSRFLTLEQTAAYLPSDIPVTRFANAMEFGGDFEDQNPLPQDLFLTLSETKATPPTYKWFRTRLYFTREGECKELSQAWISSKDKSKAMFVEIETPINSRIMRRPGDIVVEFTNPPEADLKSVIYVPLGCELKIVHADRYVFMTKRAKAEFMQKYRTMTTGNTLPNFPLLLDA